MARHTSGSPGTCRGIDVLCEDDFVGLGWSVSIGGHKIASGSTPSFIKDINPIAIIAAPLAIGAVGTAAAVAAPVAAVAPVLIPAIGVTATTNALGIDTPDEIKNLGEKFNIGDHSEDWKKWAKGFVDVSTLGLSRNKDVRDAVKDLGEKWNVGNNSVDTLKSMVNVASIVGALSGVGTLASAMLGSSTLTQGAMTAAKEYVRQSLKEKIIGKAGEELADPYIDHLIRKARRDQAALMAEEQALIDQYKEQRPGVYSLMMMAVENPNAMTQEQIQVIVNYQRDLERERALAENKEAPPDEDWVNYYTRFLAEYGVVWNPTENPGMVLRSVAVCRRRKRHRWLNWSVMKSILKKKYAYKRLTLQTWPSNPVKSSRFHSPRKCKRRLIRCTRSPNPEAFEENRHGNEEENPRVREDRCEEPRDGQAYRCNAPESDPWLCRPRDA